MSAHTPGPWEVYYSKPGHAPWVRATSGEHVTSIDSDEDEGLEANARLVAAAPELVEALESVLAQIDARPDGETHIVTTAARAALKKAGVL